MTYTLIDYTTWDRSGTGQNIIHLLAPKECELWNAAFPYQDSRPNDKGHVEAVTYFALQLLKLVRDADRNVVILAAILHDIGWSQVSQELRDLFKDPYHHDFKKVNDQTIRQKHQDESVRLATTMLKKCGYPQRTCAQILAIVGDHDTRKHFTSINAHVMGDADVLWRFTVINCENYGWKPADFIARMKLNLKKEQYLLTPAGRAIAEAELKNTEAYFG